MLITLAPIFLAFAYRSRGMAHSWGDTVNRIISWAVPVGLVCALVAYTWDFPLWVSLPCAMLAYAGACIGHSSFQGDSDTAFHEMGLYCVALLTLILLPFISTVSWDFYVHGLPMHHRVIFLFACFGGYLGAAAGWLGYRMRGGLRIFGVQWCVPGDSSWEEFYIGALAFGVPLAALGMLA